MTQIVYGLSICCPPDNAALITVSTIRGRLGHASLAMTGRYLATLRSSENPHADQVAELLGLGIKA